MHLSYSFVVEALVDAHLGLVESARAKIEEGLRLADELGVRSAGFELLGILGFLELSLGNARDADRALDRLAAAVEETGLREPSLFRFRGDAIEAKIVLGQLDDAEALLVELDRLGAALERPWVLVMACRGRALLSAARGDLRASQGELEQALVLHDRLEEPFERARTLAVLGNVLRRDRKKRAAREALEGALEIFGRLGAVLWEAKTRAELARVGGRAPATAELTPTEQQIAELIASGLSYRETADALFISPKTVQWNLSKIYRKLDIRSRAELPARLAAEDSRPRPADSRKPDRVNPSRTADFAGPGIALLSRARHGSPRQGGRDVPAGRSVRDPSAADGTRARLRPRAQDDPSVSRHRAETGRRQELASTRPRPQRPLGPSRGELALLTSREPRTAGREPASLQGSRTSR